MRCLLALCLGALTSLSARPVAAVTLRSQGRETAVEISVDVAPAGAAEPVPALQFAPYAGGVAAEARNAQLHARVELTPAGDATALTATLRYGATTAIDHEVLHLRLPGPARVVNRDLTVSALTGVRRVDLGTPIVLLTPSVVLTATHGAVAARYTPRADGSIDVALILDDRAAHPFSVFTECQHKLPPHPNFAALGHRRPVDQLTRHADEAVELRAMLYLLAPDATASPLVVERWAAGAKAAVVFTDHADRTDPAALRAVLWGASNQADPRYGHGGFLGHGLALTKTFFGSGGPAALATNAPARDLAQALVAAGSEVGSHSPSPVNDSRATVQDSLSAFAPYDTVTWIDHEPYINCEAVSVRGWDTGSDAGIVDLLVQAGYRWVWTGSDATELAGNALTDLFGGDPSAAMPVIYPLPPEPRLWVFRSVWFYSTASAFAAAISDRALDALEARRGLFVGHTYLSPSAATTQTHEHLAELYVRTQPDHEYTLDPGVDQALGRLAERARAGTTRTMTWRDAGDRLRALAGVTVTYEADGSATLRQTNGHVLDGLTVSVPRAGVDVRVDGVPLLGSRHDADRTTAWLSLPPNGTAHVRLAGADGAVPFLTPVRATVTP